MAFFFFLLEISTSFTRVPRGCSCGESRVSKHHMPADVVTIIATQNIVLVDRLDYSLLDQDPCFIASQKPRWTPPSASILSIRDELGRKCIEYSFYKIGSALVTT